MIISDFTEISEDEARKRNNFLIEAKIDGTRMEWNGFDLISDRGIIRTDRYSHIVQELRNLGFRGRGEIAVPFGNILDINKKENWGKARFYIFDLYCFNGKDYSGNDPVDNRKKIENIFLGRKFNHLRVPFRFKSFDDGMDWVKKKNGEGLVLKLGNSGFKWKNYKEAKCRITGHEAGKSHGTFLIDFRGVPGRVSATSDAFVLTYGLLEKMGKVPYAEIEYLFITEHGSPFQPRLRVVDELINL